MFLSVNFVLDNKSWGHRRATQLALLVFTTFEISFTKHGFCFNYCCLIRWVHFGSRFLLSSLEHWLTFKLHAFVSGRNSERYW